MQKKLEFNDFYTQYEYDFEFDDFYSILSSKINYYELKKINESILFNFELKEYFGFDEDLDIHIRRLLKIFIIYNYSHLYLSDQYKTFFNYLNEEYNYLDTYSKNIITYAKIHYR